MNENQNKYLSLKTAAGLCGYTRDHLGLMIRQGKLKGTKLGSYYVTTSEWIKDYLRNYADLDHHATAGKFSNKFLTQTLASQLHSGALTKGDVFVKEEKIKTPEARTINKIESNFISEIQKELIPLKEELMPSLQELSKPREAYTPTSDNYVILPIRKMKESERENILSKVS